MPRLLDLLAREEGCVLDEDVVLGNLSYAGWRDWPSHEQRAVDAFLLAWWTTLLASYPTSPCVYGFLESIRRNVGKVEVYLQAWEQTFSQLSALRHLGSVGE